jgi:DNA polymerase-3 subunit delta
MKALDLPAALAKQPLEPLYLIMGEEDHLRDLAMSSLRTAFAATAGSGLDEFNSAALYGDDCDAATILAGASEAPVFADRRLILIKAADKLPAKHGEALIPYLKSPNPTTTVAFICPKVDGRLKWTQALKEQALLIDCSPLIEPQLSAWLAREAEAVGVRVGPEAGQALKEYAASLKENAGGSLGLVRRELEKLAIYVPEGRGATVEDVLAVRGTDAGASVFKLAEAIGAGQRAQALRILRRNLEAGEQPLRILGSLVWQYRQIWKAKEAMEGRRSEGEAARLLRMPPFKVRGFLSQFSESGLRQAFERFLEADSALKGGSAVAPAMTMENLVWALCRTAPEKPVRLKSPVGQPARA